MVTVWVDLNKGGKKMVATKFNLELPMDLRGQRTTSVPMANATNAEWVTAVHITNPQDIQTVINASALTLNFPDVQNVSDTNVLAKLTEIEAKVDTLVNRRAKEPFGGSATMTKTFSSTMNGFVISNDGPSDGASLSFTVNGYTFTVAPGEVFDDSLEPFTNVQITTTVAFRAYGRG